MTLSELIQLALQLSVVVSVLAVGLGTERGDLISLFASPGLLLRSLFATNVAMLIIALAIVYAMDLQHAVVVGVVALALAPMPPVFPKPMIKAGGDPAYATGLLAVMGLVALIWIPLAVELLQRLFGVPLGIAFAPLFKMIAITILAPLIAGGVLARLFPDMAQRFQPVAAGVGGLVLTLALLAIVVRSWSAISMQIGEGEVIAVAIFTLAGLAIGHVLGGPAPERRTVLALASAARHPGVVVVIGRTAFPDETQIAPVALLALLASLVCCLPYLLWRKRLAAVEAFP